MRIIKLDATSSTNAYLKNVMLSEVLDDFTIVVANDQTNGRGQMGSIWQSEAGKNLTFSVLKKFTTLRVSAQFMLNIVVSKAVYYTLKELQIPDLSIKWPNDILSGNDKICGILIENVLQDQNIQSSVIGIGLNVNQTSFQGLSNVTSVKLLTGKSYSLDEVLHLLIAKLEALFDQYLGKKIEEIRANYEALLFRKDKPSTFKDSENKLFMGFIRGISVNGKLRIEIEDEIFKEFDFKEVQLLY